MNAAIAKLKYVLTIIALCCVGVGCQCSAKAQTSPTLKLEFQKIYDKASAAAAKRDINGVTSICSSDYYVIDERGQKTPLNEYLPRLRSTLSKASKVAQSFTINSIAKKGDSVISNVTEKSVITVQSYQQDKVMVMHTENTHEDNWVKSGKTWKLKFTKILTHKQSMGSS